MKSLDCSRFARRIESFVNRLGSTVYTQPHYCALEIYTERKHYTPETNFGSLDWTRAPTTKVSISSAFSHSEGESGLGIGLLASGSYFLLAWFFL